MLSFLHSSDVNARGHLFPARAGWILNRMSRYKGLYALATFIFLLDQLSKAWIYVGVPFQGQPVRVIPGFFEIVHWGNTGAAWGIFQGMSHWLALLAVVAIAVIYKFRHHLGLRTTAGQVSFGLLCGGIIGNLVDRLVHGYVIDFLHFHLGEYSWPAFNIADSAICVGVALYIYFSFFRPEKLEP